jgi:hypothetical protein
MRRGLYLAVGVIVALSLILGSAQAAEQQKPNAFVKFWRGLFNWPVNATKESADVVVDTTKRGADTIAQEGKDVGGALTGSGDSAKDLVVNPVKGTAETVKTGVVGTADMPGKATKGSWPAEEKN